MNLDYLGNGDGHAQRGISMKKRIKNRKLKLYEIRVHIDGYSVLPILVTKKQLAKLNALPMGKEVLLTNYYGQWVAGSTWCVRSTACNSCRRRSIGTITSSIW
jgi:hypothetical protein